MKLRDRFRKALFAFFKEEIINSVKAPGSEPFHFPELHKPVRISDTRLDFKQYCVDIDLVEDGNDRRYQPSLELQMEEKLDEARRAIFEEFVKFVTVDSQDLFNPKLYKKRRLRFSVWIGKVKQ